MKMIVIEALTVVGSVLGGGWFGKEMVETRYQDRTDVLVQFRLECEKGGGAVVPVDKSVVCWQVRTR